MGAILMAPMLLKAQQKKFYFNGVVQHWGVPAGVVKATIGASGAIGGGGVGFGGYGASFIGVCRVVPGDSVSIAVASKGGTSVVSDGEGGGGATFVYDSNTQNLLLAAAGGGGSYWQGPGFIGGNGGIDLIGNTGNPGSGDARDGADGTGGNGGAGGVATGSPGPGAGGAGWLSNGGNGQGTDTSYGGKDMANKFFGGTWPLGPGGQDSNRGGYGGGGGGGYDAGGGGGGYNGGGGGNDSAGGNGGDGGGSYLNGTVIGTPQDTGAGNGWAVISYIAINLSHTNVCVGDSNGNASVSAAGGTGSYTYNWAPLGNTNSSVTGLKAGTYTLTVMDSVGDEDSVTVVIGNRPLPSVTFSGNDSVCHGDSTMITATGGQTYLWSNGATTSSIMVKPMVNTTYSVSVTDTCTKDTSIAITVNPLPTLTVMAAKDSTCTSVTNDLLTGTPSGGTFSGTGVSGTNFDPSVAGIGSHTVTYTYTNGHGCTNTDSIKIIVTSTCLGINEVDAKNNAVQFYPNPFSQNLNIIINNPGTTTVTLYDMMGQNIESWQMEQGQHIINTGNIPTGVYMMQVKSDNGLFYNQKLVKFNQ